MIHIEKYHSINNTSPTATVTSIRREAILKVNSMNMHKRYGLFILI